MTLRTPLLGLAAVGLLVVASCATQPGIPAPRQSPVGPEPRTVDEAQADIDRWGAQLGLSAATTAPTAPPPPATPSGAGQDPARPPSTERHPAPAAPTSPGAGPTSVSADRASDSSTSSASNECVTPCRAIASMRRSVAALCRIAGDDDPRCVNARRTLDEGERRVARCGC